MAGVVVWIRRELTRSRNLTDSKEIGDLGRDYFGSLISRGNKEKELKKGSKFWKVDGWRRKGQSRSRF